MAVAALIISITSVLLTALGLYYAWQRTKYAEEQTTYAREAIKITRDRELEPDLQARIVEISPRTHYKLELASRGPKDYDEVVVTLPPKQGIRFTPGQNGVDPAETGELLKADGQDLTMAGEPLVWRVELVDGKVPAAVLRADCRAGEDDWTVTVPIEDGIKPRPWAVWA
jgi:hypothetical protein